MSCLANDFPLDKLFSAERESVHITAFDACISTEVPIRLLLVLQ